MLLNRRAAGFPWLNLSPRSAAGWRLAVVLWLLVAIPTAAQTDAGPADPEDGWETIRPTGARAEFEMPGKPRLVERSMQPVTGQEPIKVRQFITSTANGARAFVFAYHDLLNAPRDEAQADEVIRGAVQGSIAAVQGELMEMEAVELSGRPGYRYRYRFSRNRGFQREPIEYEAVAQVVLDFKRQYQVAVIGLRDARDQASETRFLGSLRMIKNESDLPPVPRGK